MNKNELTRKVAELTGNTIKSTTPIVDTIFEVIADTLSVDENVKILNFGAFEAFNRPEKVSKHPKTGEPIVIPASVGIKFRAARNFKETVNV